MLPAIAPEQVAWDIQRLLGRYHLRAMGAGYDVIVREGGLDRLGEMLKSRNLGGPVLVVSDMHVAPLYGERVLDPYKWQVTCASQLVIPAGEAHKNLETVFPVARLPGGGAGP
jgi:3-dehydroquinate synthetase